MDYHLFYKLIQHRGGKFRKICIPPHNGYEFIGFCAVLIKTVNLLLQALNLGFQCGLLPVIVG